MEDIDDIYVRYRQEKKYKMMFEKVHFVVGPEQAYKKVKHEKYAHPELELHIAVVKQQVFGLEGVDGNPHYKNQRQEYDAEIHQSYSVSLRWIFLCHDNAMIFLFVFNI